MAQSDETQRAMAQAEFTLEGADFRLVFRASVPAGPARQGELLPLARALADAVVQQSTRAVEAAGAAISCRAGCGACCRNLVAVAETEARRIAELVQALPEPRRGELRSRFAAAQQRLQESGLLDRLRDSAGWSASDYAALVGVYFDQAIDCPFLEQGACSIYAERPITCREYLVTSAPEHCAQTGSAGVQRVQLPLRLFNAVARWQAPAEGAFLERWVPLILAPEWAETHPEDPPPRPGLELLRELLAQLNDPA